MAASDLVVIGSGVAGLSAALAAADAGASVALLTAGALLAGSSPNAQGGVAAALGDDDSPSLHAADTLAVGSDLNDRAAVRVLVEQGAVAVQHLLSDGVPFDGGPSQPELGLEAGHQRRRILHGGGGATGRILTTALLEQALSQKGITTYAHTPADDLLLESGRVVAVRSAERLFRGRAVILASGGYAALWSRTTNPPVTRGAGLDLAWRAGASLADLELVQFHPTALSVPGQPAFLLSEALRGEGAQIVDEDDRPVINPLLPRDVVARAIARHGRTQGPVYLSLRHLDPTFVQQHFQHVAAQLAAWGLDLARDRLPIAPAAHYCMGGVRTDDAGRTDLAGLYAAGEVACSGVQGANRLASNSLLECLVFGRRAACAALEDGRDLAAGWTTEELPDAGDLPDGRGELKLAQLGRRLDDDLGVERDGPRLAALLRALPDPDQPRLDPAARVAALAARGAALRTESRGAHARADYPNARAEWRGHIHWRRDRAPHFERVAA